ncbi:MAG: hypothetical protein MAG581_02037 [Deltaproteobacteria bacterium]|nr:hypothetical protein [Deltaproteobacteria bacterium]
MHLVWTLKSCGNCFVRIFWRIKRRYSRIFCCPPNYRETLASIFLELNVNVFGINYLTFIPYRLPCYPLCSPNCLFFTFADYCQKSSITHNFNYTCHLSYIDLIQFLKLSVVSGRTNHPYVQHARKFQIMHK